MPASAEEEKTEYVRSEDWRVAFVEECCDVTEPMHSAPGHSVGELYAAYKIWRNINQPGGRVMSVNTFSAEMAAAYPRERVAKWRGFPTLQIKPIIGA
jgi:phage/plasmid-associated DNA primase